jgi:hypothetical protein
MRSADDVELAPDPGRWANNETSGHAPAGQPRSAIPGQLIATGLLPAISRIQAELGYDQLTPEPLPHDTAGG